MNVRCKDSTDTAQKTRRFLVAANETLTAVDPRGSGLTVAFTREHGPLEPNLFQNGEGRPKWLVFPQLSSCGFRKDIVEKLWDESKLEIKELTEAGWRNVDADDLRKL